MPSNRYRIEQPPARKFRLFSYRELLTLPRLMITEHQERFLAYAARVAGTCVAPSWAWAILCDGEFMLDQKLVFENFEPFARPVPGPYYGWVLNEDGTLKEYGYHPIWVL